jgi:hypothetical protein
MRAGFTVMTLRQNNSPPNGKSPNSPRPRKERQVKSKVKSMLIIFIVHREVVLACQTVNSVYYCDVLHHLKNDRSAGNSAYAWKGTTLRVMVASRPEVSF